MHPWLLDVWICYGFMKCHHHLCEFQNLVNFCITILPIDLSKVEVDYMVRGRVSSLWIPLTCYIEKISESMGHLEVAFKPCFQRCWNSKVQDVLLLASCV